MHPWALLWIEFLPLGLRAPRQPELSQLPTHLLQTFGEDQLYYSHFLGVALTSSKQEATGTQVSVQSDLGPCAKCLALYRGGLI